MSTYLGEFGDLRKHCRCGFISNKPILGGSPYAAYEHDGSGAATATSQIHLAAITGWQESLARRSGGPRRPRANGIDNQLRSVRVDKVAAIGVLDVFSWLGRCKQVLGR